VALMFRLSEQQASCVGSMNPGLRTENRKATADYADERGSGHLNGGTDRDRVIARDRVIR
jgi:hypothetical protein